MLHTDNTDRKEADKTITEEALFLIRNDNQHESPENQPLFSKRTGIKVLLVLLLQG